MKISDIQPKLDAIVDDDLLEQENASNGESNKISFKQLWDYIGTKMTSFRKMLVGDNNSIESQVGLAVGMEAQVPKDMTGAIAYNNGNGSLVPFKTNMLKFVGINFGRTLNADVNQTIYIGISALTQYILKCNSNSSLIRVELRCLARVARGTTIYEKVAFKMVGVLDLVTGSIQTSNATDLISSKVQVDGKRSMFNNCILTFTNTGTNAYLLGIIIRDKDRVGMDWFNSGTAVGIFDGFDLRLACDIDVLEVMDVDAKK